MMILWKFLVTNNLLPYVALAVMAYLSWNLWESNIEQKAKLIQAEKSAKFTNEAMGIIQHHNEQRFTELQKLKKSVWQEGKHEASF